jgi:hypothetical protein
VQRPIVWFTRRPGLIRRPGGAGHRKESEKKVRGKEGRWGNIGGEVEKEGKEWEPDPCIGETSECIFYVFLKKLLFVFVLPW